jgi:hypothetical protein
MKTITYNDKAAPWRRSNHLMEARLLPSTDDSHNNFSGILEEQGLTMFSDQSYHWNTPVTGTV